MAPFWEFIWGALALGAGATLCMDVWGLVQKHILRISVLDYALLGRWIGHLPQGRARHEAIARAAPVKGERTLGWAAHYLIGIVFAALFLAAAGRSYLAAPALAPALAMGLVTVAAPYFILQPAFGLGIAAARTPKPWLARLKSLSTHLVFGLGLYLSAQIWAGFLAT
ncbi:conserved protein [Tepidicaulis marinus]|uniref:Conserved protein n=1 Tax=Tepidicaulis marinus TaxID=1333998 RepID=A0A081B7A1_9HYPH|nr:DUF2938 family protein [Tepidicaulis marinus]GAK43919.1 conserved protein [Tepidicaulis marinus]